MNKLYDYMLRAAQLSLLPNAAKNPIEESGGGVSAHRTIHSHLPRYHYTLSASEESRREMGLRARAFIDSNHDYRHLALSSPAKWMRALPRRMKRLFDIVGSAAAIELFHPHFSEYDCSPWSLGSPVLFRQWRPGLHECRSSC